MKYKKYNILNIPSDSPVSFELNNSDFLIKFKGPLGFSVLGYRDLSPVYVKSENMFQSKVGRTNVDFLLSSTKTENSYSIYVECPKKKSNMIRSIIKNMFLGVFIGFRKEIKLNGIGYKAKLNDGVLELKLQKSHIVKYNIPHDISIISTSKTNLTVKGMSCARVSQVASDIRFFQRPEPYKGKGIFVDSEKIRLKQGKRQ